MRCPTGESANDVIPAKAESQVINSALTVDPGVRRDDMHGRDAVVIPAKVPPRARHGAGIQDSALRVDPGVRRDDGRLCVHAELCR